MIDEIVASVVGRIDVDELDLAQIRLLEKLEGVEVVPFDEEVLGRVEVDGLLADGTEGLRDGCVGRECCGQSSRYRSWGPSTM